MPSIPTKNELVLNNSKYKRKILCIETSMNLYVYQLILQMSRIKAKPCLGMSQTIFRAVESNYMQKDQAEYSCLGNICIFPWNLIK